MGAMHNLSAKKFALNRVSKRRALEKDRIHHEAPGTYDHSR